MLAFALAAELLVAALLDAFLPDEQTDLRLGMMVLTQSLTRSLTHTLSGSLCLSDSV